MPVTRAALASCLMALCAAGAAALEVTEVAQGPSGLSADFRLSGAMTLAGVSRGRGLGGEAVVLPLERPQYGAWRSLRVLDKRFFDKLLSGRASLRGDVRRAMPELKVLSAQPLASKHRIANVEVSFDGELLAVFGVVRGRYGGLDSYKAVPPDYLVVNDEALRGELDRLVVEAGKRACYDAVRAGGSGKES